MKIKGVFLVFLIIFSAAAKIQAATDEGYGEDQSSLGQFVDSFDTSGNVSVAVNVIRNATLEAMELNYSSGPENFLSGWAYWKRHTIVGSPDGAQTNYQVGIKVYYGSGTDGNETVDGIQFGKVYLDSECRTDFGDVRFTNSSGVDLLYFWIESQVDSDYAIIWVLIPSFPADPESIGIFIYWGKGDETTTSDGKNTFPDLFDHFLGSGLNLTVWNVDANDGSATVAGSIVKVQGNAGANRYAFSSKIPFRTDYNHALRYRSLIELTTASYQITQIGWATWGILLYGMSRSVHGAEQAIWRDSFGNAENDIISDTYFDTYLIYEITRTGTVGELFVGGVSVATGDMNPDSDIIGAQIYVRDSEFDLYCDWILIREWTINEPVHTTWGSKEDPGGYSGDGYFTTTDYLSDPLANGLALVHLSNTTIPANTAITLEFSEDNSTWILNDWQPLFGGLESVDLRDLFYSAGYYVRHNLSTTDSSVTPRVYQSRLITTIGNASAPEIVNVTGSWIEYNATAISATVGTVDDGDLGSTFFIDGDMFNVSEVVGIPGMQISINFTDVDPAAESLWVLFYGLYDGNLNHDFDIEVWDFENSVWVEDSHIPDMAAFGWINSTIYPIRIPNEFLRDGEVRVRLDHESPGNINHDLFIEYIRLQAFIPLESAAKTAAETFQLFWIAIAISLMIIGILLASMWPDEGDP